MNSFVTVLLPCIWYTLFCVTQSVGRLFFTVLSLSPEFSAIRPATSGADVNHPSKQSQSKQSTPVGWMITEVTCDKGNL